MFTIFAVVLFVVTVGLTFAALSAIVESETGGAIGFSAAGILCLIGALLFQTHTIIPAQSVGITKNSISQQLAGPMSPGVVSKPFFGKLYYYPWAASYEQCRPYTPALKGSYGITVDLCFYFNTQQVDWLQEVNRTGTLKAEEIINVWGNSVVGAVARSVKDYTPEELSDNRSEVESAIYENVLPWFTERGIPLTRVSFVNWDFTSPEVAKSFDESIVSQRRITEQTALFEASKISREREMYEAETSRMVAETQRESLNALGLEGDAAVQYMWIRMMQDANKVPDVVILGSSEQPVSISTK